MNPAKLPFQQLWFLFLLSLILLYLFSISAISTRYLTLQLVRQAPISDTCTCHLHYFPVLPFAAVSGLLRGFLSSS